jgi:hypothetical protein
MTPTYMQYQGDPSGVRSTLWSSATPRLQHEQVALVFIKAVNYQILHHLNLLAQRSPPLPLWCCNQASVPWASFCSGCSFCVIFGRNE